MKNLINCVCAILIALCLAGCATTKSSANSSGSSSLERIAGEIKNADPATGDSWFINVQEGVTETYSASPFYAATAYMMLDEKFAFSQIMDEGQRLAFIKALMNNLPVVNSSDDVRAVVVGNVFDGAIDDSKHLVIIIDTVELNSEVIPDVAYGYRFTTNAIFLQDSQTGESDIMNTGMYFTGMNYSFVTVPYENGKLVTSGNLNLGDLQYDSSMSFMDKGNLMDVFLKDEDESNDAQIEEIYNEIIAANGVDASIKNVLAPLNYGLYLVKQGRLEEAEILWDELYASNNTELSLEYIFGNDIPNLIYIMNNY